MTNTPSLSGLAADPATALAFKDWSCQFRLAFGNDYSHSYQTDATLQKLRTRTGLMTFDAVESGGFAARCQPNGLTPGPKIFCIPSAQKAELAGLTTFGTFHKRLERSILLGESDAQVTG